MGCCVCDNNEAVVIVMEISTVAERIWYLALLTTLLFFGFLPSLCDLIAILFCGSHHSSGYITFLLFSHQHSCFTEFCSLPYIFCIFHQLFIILTYL